MAPLERLKQAKLNYMNAVTEIEDSLSHEVDKSAAKNIIEEVMIHEQIAIDTIEVQQTMLK